MRTLTLIQWMLLACFGVANAQEIARPRVLVLGDSVYRQPASEMAKELKPRVDVVYKTTPTGEVFYSKTLLDHLDDLLGQDNWDVIHVNVGLGDLVHRVPEIDSFRLLPVHAGGVRCTTPEQYEQNLEELVRRLKASGAKLIWATTTPIRHSRSKVFEMGSEIEYNTIARNVMSRNDVQINDMYDYVFNLIDMKRPASHGADPFFFDRKSIHPPIVRHVVDALDLETVVDGP